jgi:hypothetical protein
VHGKRDAGSGDRWWVAGAWMAAERHPGVVFWLVRS